MSPPLIDQWTAIVAFLLPLLVSTIVQSHWKEEVKTAWTVFICVCVSIIQLAIEGKLTSHNMGQNAIVVTAGAIAVYHLFWKPTGIAPAVEKATNLDGGSDQ
jgi:quinol-cytochrome oxidoreductase complex cytochrome b subunit